MRGSRILWSSNYPRIASTSNAISHDLFLRKFDCIPAGRKGSHEVTIRGRVTARRSAGQNLHFLDIVQDGLKIQGVAQNCTEEVTKCIKTLRQGDHVQVSGTVGRQERGALSVYAHAVTPLARCMHRVPDAYTDVEKRLRNRHVDFLVNQGSVEVMRRRSQIIADVRRYLTAHGFMELETSILQASASGAIARPFRTHATALGSGSGSGRGTALTLRIAPELALKRAVVSGFTRVFEIGKCFRNEGLSRRHNPEFTTCEFYAAYDNLDDLMRTTEDLLQSVENSLLTTLTTPTTSRTATTTRGPGGAQEDETTGHTRRDRVFGKFQRLEFVPTLERELGCPLPTTRDGLLSLCRAKRIAVPLDDTSLGNLYDVLATKYIEPLCTVPTFILNPPAILSPLAKSTGGIAHRFELVVQGMELINAYEEENDPAVQRAKFLAQSSGASASASGDGKTQTLTPDEEDFCSVLEWGMPPTAGWGLGIDRLVMLLTGTKRISEVMMGGGIQHARRAHDGSSAAERQRDAALIERAEVVEEHEDAEILGGGPHRVELF